MIVKLLTEPHLEFLSLKGGCTGSSESTHIKMPHCWKSHALAQFICLKALLQQGISEPVFYGHLVYKFKRIVGKPNFSDQFKMINKHYKRVGYSMDIMRQSACLVVNPIMVYSYGFLFNCTTVGQASDSMASLI